MAGVKALVLAALLVRASPAAADPLDRWAVHIDEASRRFAIPPSWIRDVIRAESGGSTSLWGTPIVSRAGAMGLMQLMPGTWREMRTALRLGDDPHDPRDNILAGSLYLRRMYDRFGYPGLFAAYNAGPARYSDYLAGARSLPAETRLYVRKLAPAARPAPGSEPGRVALVVPGRAGRAPETSVGQKSTADASSSAARPGSGLFVGLSERARTMRVTPGGETAGLFVSLSASHRP